MWAAAIVMSSCPRLPGEREREVSEIIPAQTIKKTILTELEIILTQKPLSTNHIMVSVGIIGEVNFA